MIGQQTGSDKRYFSNEIEAMYRYIYVEKRTILIQLENYDLINVYILRINSDHKGCLFAVFEISAIYILYSICTVFGILNCTFTLPVSIIPQMLHTRFTRTNGRSLGTFQKRIPFRKFENIG